MGASNIIEHHRTLNDKIQPLYKVRLIPYLSMLVVSVVDRDLGLNLDNHTLNAGPGGISFD